MKALGIILLLLGALSFIIPIPHSEDHGVRIGDARIGVRTEHRDRLPPAAGIVLLAGGVVALIVGMRKS
jgi:hypothetical protein